MCGCGQPESYDGTKIQKASLQILEEQAQSQVMHFDYDINSKRLIKQYETVNQLDPNKLEIAINNFLAKTNFRGQYHQLKFDYSEANTESINFYFNGNYDFERKADEEIFKKALELTIANYTDYLNINLFFNEKNSKN